MPKISSIDDLMSLSHKLSFFDKNKFTILIFIQRDIFYDSDRCYINRLSY